MIKGIDSVLVFVTDLNKQTHFYSEVLGLELVHSNPSMAQFRFPNTPTTLVLHKYDPENDKKDEGKVHFNFAVANLNKTIDILKANGVKIVKDKHDAGFGYFAAVIEDPEGNELDLLEPKNN